MARTRKDPIPTDRQVRAWKRALKDEDPHKMCRLVTCGQIQCRNCSIAGPTTRVVFAESVIAGLKAENACKRANRKPRTRKDQTVDEDIVTTRASERMLEAAIKKTDDILKTTLKNALDRAEFRYVGPANPVIPPEIFMKLDTDTQEKPLGLKTDTGKPRWSLVPYDALLEIVKVLTFGATKYADNNWQHVDNHEDRYFSAMLRHLTAWKNGQRTDDETGLSHLAHAGCCLLFLLWFEVRK